MKRVVLSVLLAAMPLTFVHAAEPAAEREPYGIGLEGFAYPYPVSMLPLVNDGEQVRMAYMDIAAAAPNGRTVVLLHGRNFPSSYWAPVIKTLSEAGYRVVVPDQIGFGKSSKPAADLHFDTLARNTIALLDHLRIAKAEIVAHSLGGMLGVRIARAYPDRSNISCWQHPSALRTTGSMCRRPRPKRFWRTRTSSPPKPIASSWRRTIP